MRRVSRPGLFGASAAATCSATNFVSAATAQRQPGLAQDVWRAGDAPQGPPCSWPILEALGLGMGAPRPGDARCRPVRGASLAFCPPLRAPAALPTHGASRLGGHSSFICSTFSKYSLKTSASLKKRVSLSRLWRATPHSHRQLHTHHHQQPVHPPNLQARHRGALAGLGDPLSRASDTFSEPDAGKRNRERPRAAG